MASSLNKVQIIGNLTADPEVRETPNGQKVANFAVATNRKWKDSNGGMQEKVEFHNCVAWRWNADFAEQYMHKGKKVYLEGYLETKSWEDTSGAKRYKTEIVTDNIILLSSASNGEGGNSSAPANAVASSSKPKKEEEINIEDIPF